MKVRQASKEAIGALTGWATGAAYSVLASLVMPMVVHAVPMDLNFFTDFEGINSRSGIPFRLEDANGAAELSGDAFAGFAGIFELYFSGSRAWMVNPGGSGSIAFMPNAAEVEFWARTRSFANGSTAITAFDSQDQVIDTVTLSPANPFQLVSFTGSIDRIEVVNNATGASQMNAIDDFGFTLESPLPPLRAGDADLDLDFDQFDLIEVQQSAKYLTGQSATWGEGDWNGAPGGDANGPPPGDGLFDQFDIIAAQQAAIYLTGPYAAISAGGQAADVQTSIGYNAATGEVWIDAPGNAEITSINVSSASAIFTAASAENLGGTFDIDADDNIFKATFGTSFGFLSFGNVAQPGLSEEFVLNDLSVIGSLQEGGPLGDVDLVFVPEPTSLVPLLLGALALVVRFRVGARSSALWTSSR